MQTMFIKSFDGDGNMYGGDVQTGKLVKTDKNGQLLLAWSQIGSKPGEYQPSDTTSTERKPNGGGIVPDSKKNIFQADTYNHRIQKFDSNGNYITGWGTKGIGDGQFDSPVPFLIDNQDNIFVVEFFDHRVQKFSPDGQFLLKFGSNGESDGQFNIPLGIAVDKQGNIYVSDFSGRVQKFDPTGKFLMKFGGKGESDGQFVIANAIVVDNNGNIYVGDKLGKVQKFDSI